MRNEIGIYQINEVHKIAKSLSVLVLKLNGTIKSGVIHKGRYSNVPCFTDELGGSNPCEIYKTGVMFCEEGSSFPIEGNK